MHLKKMIVMLLATAVFENAYADKTCFTREEVAQTIDRLKKNFPDPVFFTNTFTGDNAVTYTNLDAAQGLAGKPVSAKVQWLVKFLNDAKGLYYEPAQKPYRISYTSNLKVDPAVDTAKVTTKFPAGDERCVMLVRMDAPKGQCAEGSQLKLSFDFTKDNAGHIVGSASPVAVDCK